MKHSLLGSLLFLWLGLFPAATFSQDDPPARVDESTPAVIRVASGKGPEDALGRGTPRSAAIGFLKACSEFDFDRASEYLDLRNLPPRIAEIGGHELARQLNHVISRSVWLDDYNVSDHPEGAKGDGLPGFRDELVKIKTPDGKETPIWLQRVPRGDGELIWKVSNRSVALIPELYDEFSYPEFVERIRKWFPEDASFLGFETFKWFIMVMFAFISWPLFWAIGWLLSRAFSSPDRETYPLVRKAFTWPFILLSYLFFGSFIIEALGAGARAQQVMDAKTVIVIVVVWALWSAINLFKVYKQSKLNEAGRPGAAKLMQPMTTLIKLMILIFGLLFWLNNLGVNITTVLAGLGVGGLAVALALQKPIEDMMGALTIFTQASIRVGDLCKYGEFLGVVEDIGLRTVRLRTLTNTVVTIPNSRIAHLEIENLSYRTKIRFWPTLRLRYDTTPEQLKEVRDGIRNMLVAHDKVHEDPIRVRFTDFDKDAILLKVHSFLKTTDFSESLEIGEELNYQIMKIVQKAGTQFALPSATMFVEGDTPLSHT
jgi:MscS family membrane protein